MDDQNIVCPFCHENNFDKIGLKKHLSFGLCEGFENTETEAEEILRKRFESEAADE